MARCHRNDVGSLILDRPTAAPAGSGGHFRLWSAFSGASFRRKIFDAVSCGGSSRYRHHNDDDAPITESEEGSVLTEKVEEKAKTKTKTKGNGNGKSEKLLDLLSLAEWSESEAEVAATKRKVEVLEKLKRVVRDLQVDEDSVKRKLEAAREVRLLAKEDLEARGTLAMLGAIPPLVGMLDFDDDDTQIASLYALLNLGIGNDL